MQTNAKGGRSTAHGCGVRPSEIDEMAPLCAEILLQDLPIETRQLHQRIVNCPICRERLKGAVISYMAQAVADASYEARQMNEWLGIGEDSPTRQRA